MPKERSENGMSVKDFIGDAAVYDENGQYIWAKQKDGFQMICEIRGWGAIQNLFKDEEGFIEEDKAEDFQDELGRWIADAINKKLKEDA